MSFGAQTWGPLFAGVCAHHQKYDSLNFASPHDTQHWLRRSSLEVSQALTQIPLWSISRLFCPPYTNLVLMRLSKTLPLYQFKNGSVMGACNLSKGLVRNSSSLPCETIPSESQETCPTTYEALTLVSKWSSFGCASQSLYKQSTNNTIGPMPYCPWDTFRQIFQLQMVNTASKHNDI